MWNGDILLQIICPHFIIKISEKYNRIKSKDLVQYIQGGLRLIAYKR